MLTPLVSKLVFNDDGNLEYYKVYDVVKILLEKKKEEEAKE